MQVQTVELDLHSPHTSSRSAAELMKQRHNVVSLYTYFTSRKLKKMRGSGSTKDNIKVVRFVVFITVAMKNAVLWDIRTKFIPHRRHITSPLQNAAS
jgi:hypothetical protein